MSALGKGSEERSDIGLFGCQVAGEPRVEGDDGQLVKADQTGDKLQDLKLALQRELILGVLEVLLEELLGKALGVVEEVKRREIEGMGGVFLLLLPIMGQSSPSSQPSGIKTHLLTFSKAFSTAFARFFVFLLIPV